MSQLLKSPSALLLLPLLTNIVASDFRFNGKPRVTTEMMSVLKIQQVKERILRGLNMTVAPRMLHPDKSRIKVRKPMQDTDRQPNVSMILSEAGDDDRTDTVSFKFNSMVRAQVQDLEAALLVVILRSNRETGKRNVWQDGDRTEQLENFSKRGTSKEKRRKKYKRLGLSNYPFDELLGDVRVHINTTSDFVGNKSSSKSMQTNLNGISSNVISSNNDVHKEQRSDERREKRSRQLRGLKSWRVKVVVKAIDPETGKRRRIAVEKMSVKRSSTMAVPLSKDILIAAAASSNHTLQLQMTCKRCKGRVHIEKVYKTVRRKNKKHVHSKARLNPHRPYLFITTGSNVASSDFRNGLREAKPDSPNDIARTRTKRRSYSSSSEKLNSSQNNTARHASYSYFSCCSRTVELTFHELGIDVVLYPKNVSILYCVSPCNTNDSDNVNNSSLHTKTQLQFKINYPSSNVKKKNCSFTNTDSSIGSGNHVRSLYAIESVPPTEHQLNYPVSSQLHGNCVLLIVSPINVIYLSGSDTVRRANLDNVTYLSCDCPGRR